MARNPSAFAKRMREQDRARKREEREKRRAIRRDTSAPDRSGEEDPDLAGIVPGPQRQPWMEGYDDKEPEVTEDIEEEAQAPA